MRRFGHVGQDMQRILGALTLALVMACGQDDGGKLGGPCVSTSAAFFQCSAGLACDALGDGTCKPADSFGTANGPCAHDPGVLANPTCNVGLTCEIPGQNRATRCANVVTVPLTPDATGRIDATGTGLAIQGRWSVIADSLGDDGLPREIVRTRGTRPTPAPPSRFRRRARKASHRSPVWGCARRGRPRRSSPEPAARRTTRAYGEAGSPSI